MRSKAHLSCRLLEHNKQRCASAYYCFNERFNYIIGEKKQAFSHHLTIQHGQMTLNNINKSRPTAEFHKKKTFFLLVHTG